MACPWRTRPCPAERQVAMNGGQGTRGGLAQHLTLEVSGLAPSKGNKLATQALNMHLLSCGAEVLKYLPFARCVADIENLGISLCTSKITEADY